MMGKTLFSVNRYLILYCISIIPSSSLCADLSVNKNKSYSVRDFFYNLITGKRECTVEKFDVKAWHDKGIKQWYLAQSNQPIYGIDASNTIQYTKLFKYLYAAKNNNLEDLDNETYVVIDELASYDTLLDQEIRTKESLKNKDAPRELKLQHLEEACESYRTKVISQDDESCLHSKNPLLYTEQDNIAQIYRRLVENMEYKTTEDKDHAFCSYFTDRRIVNKVTGKLDCCKDDESYISIVQDDQGITDNGCTDIPVSNPSSPCYALKPGSTFIKYDWFNPERVITASVLLLGLAARYFYKKQSLSK